MALLYVGILLSLAALGDCRGLRSRSAADVRMDVKAVQQELQEALRGALGQGHGIHQKHITDANATLLPMFKSLPKNEHGRVGATAMRYAVQRYFSKNHGWIIKGFESHSTEQQVQGAGILGSKVPGYVEATLEEMLQKGGFALADILTVVIVVERLIFDEVASSVEFAYHLNHMAPEKLLNRDSLLTVLESHMIVEMLEKHESQDGSQYDEKLHLEDRQEMDDLYPNWGALKDFMRDVVATESSSVFLSGSHNPFSKLGTELFSFDHAVRIAQSISNEYGRWGNQECIELREFLSDMDRGATGRVRLADFYAATGDKFALQESQEYLRELGALDESSKVVGPQVIISNYAYGMSNCLSSTPYYSVCCLNECEGLLQQIEAQLAKPSATPTEIQDAMKQISVNSFPGNVSEMSAKFHTRLEEISSRGNGRVPLHGRLFAQWLHYAFPHQCPFPHAAGSLRPQTQGERLAKEMSTLIDGEELQMHMSGLKMQSNNSNKTLLETAKDEEEEELWSWDEELMHTPQSTGPPTVAYRSGITFAFWPGMIAAGILIAVKQLQSALRKITNGNRCALLPMTVKSHDL